jgi:peroxiredoxin Q/BCP
MKLRVNDVAPDFSGVDQNGNNLSLKDFKNKWLLLYFYPKDDTFGCTKEACNFRDNIESLSKKISIVGVSADNLESHKKFSEKYSLNFPIIPDPEKKIIDDYDVLGIGGITAKRTSFLINPEGKIAKIYEKVNPDIHVAEVEKDLDSLSG